MKSSLKSVRSTLPLGLSFLLLLLLAGCGGGGDSASSGGGGSTSDPQAAARDDATLQDLADQAATDSGLTVNT
ncbi:MAG: hypothetical protein O7G32_09385, partial [SAR324 cluster bacterium]|nr:hypothetical protein [SAR324 cluster bacterium]